MVLGLLGFVSGMAGGILTLKRRMFYLAMGGIAFMILGGVAFFELFYQPTA